MTKRKPVRKTAIPHAVKLEGAHGFVKYDKRAGQTFMEAATPEGVWRVTGKLEYTPTTTDSTPTGTPIFAASGFMAESARQGVRVTEGLSRRPWLCRVLGWHDWVRDSAKDRCTCGCGAEITLTSKYFRQCKRCGRRELFAWQSPDALWMKWALDRETRFCARTHKAFTSKTGGD